MAMFLNVSVHIFRVFGARIYADITQYHAIDNFWGSFFLFRTISDAWGGGFVKIGRPKFFKIEYLKLGFQ